MNFAAGSVMKIDYMGVHPNRKKLVTELITQKYRDVNRKFLEAILPKLRAPM